MADIKDHVSVLRNNQDLLPGGEGENFWPLHGWTHEDGGYDEISIEGLSGVTGDMQDARWLRGIEIEDSIPLDGEVLVYNDFTGEWEFQPVSGLGIHWSRNVVNEYLYPTSVDDTIQIGDGDASQPAISFASALDSGIYYDPLDVSINFGTAGEGLLKLKQLYNIVTSLETEKNNNNYWFQFVHERLTGNAPHFDITCKCSNPLTSADLSFLASTGTSGHARMQSTASGGRASNTISSSANSDIAEVYLFANATGSDNNSDIKVHSESDGLDPTAFSYIDIAARSDVYSDLYLRADTIQFHDEYTNHLFDVYYSAGSVIDSQQEYFIIQNQRTSAGQDATFWIDLDADNSGNIFIENTVVDGSAYSLFKALSTNSTSSIVINSVSTNSTASLDLICESSAGDSEISLDHEIYFDDSYRPGSTWTDYNGIPLAKSSTEWSNIKTLLGGSNGSILAAIYASATGGGGGFDAAYDFGSPGGGKSATIDSGAVDFTLPSSASGAVLSLTNQESTNTSELLLLYNSATLSTGYNIFLDGAVGGDDEDYNEMGGLIWSIEGSHSIGHGNTSAGASNSRSYTQYYWYEADETPFAGVMMRAEGDTTWSEYAYIRCLSTPSIRIATTGFLDFQDQYNSGSTWSGTTIPLSLSSTEWSNIETIIGSEGSIFGAIIGATEDLITEGSAESASSTTSGTYQQRLRVTTPSLTSGIGYLILWNMELQAVADNEVQGRVQLDDTTTIAEPYYNNEPYATRGTACSGVYYSDSLSGTVDIDIDWRNAYGGGLVYCGRARIVVLRVNI